MTEKRYYTHKHSLQENKVHDKICHNFMNIDETVEHMNNQYWKYNQLKKENEQLKLDKQQLHRAMSREEVRHKQFKNKVFDLVNEKIKEYQKYDEHDTEKYYIGTQLLNNLKKELLE